ncbi:MAG: discoidin domain-containing protein, partial [Planctomycetales bacterium]|nr:discoidin domain-containing protein [Planctomycetales bacterium]
MHKKWQLAVGTLSVLFATATMTSAANILWDPVGTVEGTQSILTEGVLAQAINATNSGVDHTVTAGAEVITFTSRSPILASITGDQVFEPPRTFDPEFDLILGSHTWQGGGGQFEIENLVPGTNYAVQIFGVMDGRGCCAARDTRFSDGTGLGSASDNVTRGDGEFVIGRFVADSATQVIEALPGDGGGGTDPGLSAYVVRALVDTGVDLFPVLEINRDTGNATLRNNTANDLTISTLSIRSTRGSLNPAQWNSISGNQDSNNGGGFDPDDEWYQFAPGSANELSEGTLGAQTLVKQSTVVNLGNIWSKNPVENDLSGRMLLSDNETLVNLQIRFTGNGGEAFAIGDLNFDGSVNALDWSIHRDNAFSDMSGLNLVQSYQRGDYDGDGDSDLDDFSTFVNAYEAANGAGSFAALNSVPEPTFALLLMPILGALAWGRRRIKATTVLALVVTATVLVMQATPAQAVLLPGSATNVAIGGTASQSSNYSDTDFLADLGIDGNIYNFTHTINTDETPSWQVSLAGGSTDIGTIVLHNRDSCCQLRLQDITVTVRNAADTQDLYVSPVLNPGNVLNNPDRIELNLVELTGGTINGGVVKVSRTPIPGLANDDGRVLSLGEVQVFGPGANVRPNIAPLGTATQSSNFNGTFVAGLAIDGSLSNFTHTASGDAAATWTLDLGLESQIDGVALWNRGGGCCPERMRDITLDVLASDGTTVVRSTTLNQGNALGSPLVVSDNMLGQDIVGRYIRVSRTPDPLGVSTDDMNVLSLGEVEVFGEIPQLKIVVNRTTGAIELQNNSFAPLDIRAYAI